MPDLNTRSKSLSQLYVFYNRLQDDGYSDLYGYVRSSLDAQSTELTEAINNVNNLKYMAQQEANKETSLLNTIFNANVSVDLNDNASIKQFIDTLNACLNLKEVYDRNIYLIKNSNGAKSVISFYPTYFMQAWNAKWPAISDSIIKQIGTKTKIEAITIIEQEVDKNIGDIVEDGIRRMFQAKPELTSMDDNMGDAYLQLLNAIGQVQKKGSLANQIYNIYKLDEIKKMIADEIKTKSSRWVNQTIKGFNPDSAISKNKAQRGGLSLEAIENTISNLIVSGISKTKDVKISGQVYSTGSLGTKADNMITFNLDSEMVQRALETNEAVSRQRNIQMFDRLGQNLKNVKDGYVVYSSDKNYTINDGFKNRGGFGGENISARTYLDMMKNVNKNIDTFVGTILQTAEGAIGDNGGIRGQVERAIAHDFAYLLFDDFDTIGKDTGDGKAIHIMNLNGVLIPLSFFLQIFAQAIETWIYNPTTIIKVQVSAPEILFPRMEQQNAWQRANPDKSPWDYQRTKALDGTTIAMHFLGNFKSIIQDYL